MAVFSPCFETPRWTVAPPYTEHFPAVWKEREIKLLKYIFIQGPKRMEQADNMVVKKYLQRQRNKNNNA